MKSRMPERARTDPWEPQGSNPLGPPGPDLPHVIRHRPLIVLSLVASGSQRLGPWCAYWSDPSRNACPFLISGFPEFAPGVGYGVPGTPACSFSQAAGAVSFRPRSGAGRVVISLIERSSSQRGESLFGCLSMSLRGKRGTMQRDLDFSRTWNALTSGRRLW